MADTLETLEIEVKYRASSAAAEIRKTTGAIQSLSKETKKAVTPMSNFVASLKRIAFYRFIRSIIKNITQAFTEGLEKAYLFSSKMSGEGNRFAKALDSMTASSNQMKGQIGSAFISLLAALQPIIEAIINLVVRLADALSQIFAAFTGGTYLKAVKTTSQFSDALTKGAGAAKEWKNQLLGFDEINRLNEPSGGGGGGGTNPLAGYNFEDTPLEDWAMKLREKILWLQEHLDTIKTLALLIGAALLGWKIGAFLANLSTISPVLSTVLGLAVAIGGAFVFIKGACDAWKNGVDWDNLTLMIAGVVAVAVGLALAFGSVAAAVSLLIAGIAMLVIGVRDWIKTGELSEQTFWLLEAAIIAVGVALGILIGWPAALIAGFTAALGVIIYYWDEIIGRIATAIQAIREFFSLKAINDRWDSMQADGSVYLTGFASGGFPDEGSLFVANEAGPEMVGTIGGRTAVAPSDDIVEAVRQGVYDAVMAANSNGNGDVNVKVFLDSREIRAGQERLARAWG